MNKVLRIGFRYEILFLFVFFEVLLFKTRSPLQFIISILEFIFVLLALISDIKTGLMYLISFTILTVGLGNYEDMDILPYNFWGIRMFGFSLNILFSFSTFAILLLKNKFRFSFDRNENSEFFIFFIIYSLAIGIISVIFSVNHVDNFFSDLMTYTPLILYLFFISKLNIDLIKKILKYTLSLTVIMMIISSLLDRKFKYGNNFFVLQNGLYFILPVALIMMRDFYTRTQFAFLIGTLIILVFRQEYILSGKTIVMGGIFVVWFAYYYKKWQVPLVVLGLVALIFLNTISSSILGFFSGNVIGFKFSQIFDVFTVADLDKLAASFTSMGNLIAEAKTVFAHLTENKFFLFFGKGFGGGVPDVLGYLAQWAGRSGYAAIDLVRDNFYKMHLPVYEIILKSGIFGFLLYVYLLVKVFLSKNKYSIIYFCLLFLIFYVCKEFIVVTLLFLKLLKETNSGPEHLATVENSYEKLKY